VGDEKDPKEIKIEVDEATGRGTYVNLAVVHHNETEFVLDFIFVQPGMNKAKVSSRIVTNPMHMKRLLAAIQDNIKKYETKFGPIKSTGSTHQISQIVHAPDETKH
jgi:hypothetical protein